MMVAPDECPGSVERVVGGDRGSAVSADVEALAAEGNLPFWILASASAPTLLSSMNSARAPVVAWVVELFVPEISSSVCK